MLTMALLYISSCTKTFDRVAYCQLFRLLIKRGLPAVIIRFMCNMYVDQRTRLVWNGVCYAMYSVSSGVKQGGGCQSHYVLPLHR